MLHGLALAAVLLPAPPLAQVRAQPSFLQRLREILGIQRPVAVAGSRGRGDLGICLVSPWPGGEANGITTAATPSGAPPIATREPLAEVQILQGSSLLWRQRASTAEPIRTPLAWPIQPLQPGETVTLRLRPLNNAGSGFAQVLVRRAAGPLSPPPDPPIAATGRWLEAIGKHTREDRPAAALELLLRGALAGNPSLREHSVEMVRSACRR